MRFGTLKQLFVLLTSSKQKWLLPVLLLLIIVALAVVFASLSPVPVFMYTFI